MNRYRWAAAGDVNAFFGLMLDNVADLVLTVGLLHATFGFPVDFAITHMVPGTALGVLVGDLLFTWMAFRLARRTGSATVTAMPLGLDTPSTFGMVFFVLGPAYRAAQERGLEPLAAAEHAWHIGMAAIVVSGVFKLCCALFSGAVRRWLPRAGLLGSLAALALVLISFLPLMDVMMVPVVGLVSLAIILTTLVAKVPFPGRVPGALAALLIGGTIYFAMSVAGLLEHGAEAARVESGLALLLPRPSLAWLNVFHESLVYLPVVIPFALATVVGGIDCTESAAAAGDEYDTREVVAVEGLATVLAGLCGGVIQTTPYIGHPAYKAMGGRAAYTLATALFVGGVAMLGLFSHLYYLIPKAAIFPILIFVGLEITAQSFHATPRKHYAAVALACAPALAYLALFFAQQVVSASGLDEAQQPELARQLQTLRMLSAGFIVTSLLWASTLAAIIDRRPVLASTFLLVAAACSLFGVIHSPFAGSPVFWPWIGDPPAGLPPLPAGTAGQTPIHLAAGYALTAAVLLLWSRLVPQDEQAEVAPSV